MEQIRDELCFRSQSKKLHSYYMLFYVDNKEIQNIIKNGEYVNKCSRDCGWFTFDDIKKIRMIMKQISYERIGYCINDENIGEMEVERTLQQRRERVLRRHKPIHRVIEDRIKKKRRIQNNNNNNDNNMDTESQTNSINPSQRE